MPETELELVADDAELLQLAARPAGRLFPILDRTHAFTPLLAALVVLSGLVVLEHRTTRAIDAQWGLRSVAVLTAGQFDHLVDPPADRWTETIRWQPPLGTWLTALCMRLFGSARPLSLVAVSACATVGSAAMMLLLCGRMGQPRLAIWVVLMLAFHAPFLQQIPDAAPHALAILFALTTFWGFLRHLQTGGALVSTWLLLAGISLGLCVLAGGPLALLVLTTLVLHVFGLVGTSARTKHRTSGRPVRVWAGWAALQSFGLLVLTGFAVGGWWVLMMYSRHGTEFLNNWLTFGGFRAISAVEFTAPSTSSPASVFAAQLVRILGVYLVLSLFGLASACREAVSGEDEQHRQWLQFLICWLGSGLIVYPSFVRHPAASSELVTLWQRYLMLPAIVFAGRAIETVAQRRSRIPTVFLLTLATLYTVPLLDVGDWLRPLTEQAGLIAAAAAAVVGMWLLHRYCRQNETRRRAVLSGMIFAQVATGIAVGVTLIGKRDPMERELSQVREALSQAEVVDLCTLVSEDTPPTQLVFALRAAWPDAEMTLADNWESALRQILAKPTAARQMLLADWSQRESRPLNLQLDGYRLNPLSESRVFHGRELRLFVLAAISEQ